MRVLLFTMFVTLSATPVFADDPTTTFAPPLAAVNVTDELTAELNATRIQYGLPPLVTDPSLNATCQSWAGFMASSGQFRHGGGEHVIAMGQHSAREAIQSWLSSPGHRAWLLSRSSASVGWGLATGRNGQRYWAGMFSSSGPIRQAIVAPRTETKPVTYAEIHTRVGQGEVVQFALGETAAGFVNVDPTTAPKELAPGLYRAFWNGTERRMDRISSAMPQSQAPLAGY